MNYQVYEALIADMPEESRPSVEEFIADLIHEHPGDTNIKENEWPSLGLPAMFDLKDIRNVHLSGIGGQSHLIFTTWGDTIDDVYVDCTGIRIGDPHSNKCGEEKLWLVVCYRESDCDDQRRELFIINNDKKVDLTSREILELLLLSFITRPEYFGVAEVEDTKSQDKTITIFPADFPASSPIILNREDFMRFADRKWWSAHFITLPSMMAVPERRLPFGWSSTDIKDGEVSDVVNELMNLVFTYDYVTFGDLQDVYCGSPPEPAGLVTPILAKMNHHEISTYFKILSYLGIKRRLPSRR